MKQPVAFLASFALALPMLAQSAWTPPTPAQMAQHEVSRYTTLLSLSAEQETQAASLFTEEATTSQPLHSSERTNHKALEAAIKNGDMATIQSTATTLGTVHGEMTAVRALTEAKFYALLTADQKTKYAELEMHGHRGGGPGGPSGHGGPPAE